MIGARRRRFTGRLTASNLWAGSGAVGRHADDRVVAVVMAVTAGGMDVERVDMLDGAGDGVAGFGPAGLGHAL